MPATEESILRDFLLRPASLPSIISIHEFTKLLPLSHQSNPLVEELYRGLQHQHATSVDNVKRNITYETSGHKKHKRNMARARLIADKRGLVAAGLRGVNMESQVRLPPIGGSSIVHMSLQMLNYQSWLNARVLIGLSKVISCRQSLRRLTGRVQILKQRLPTWKEKWSLCSWK